MQLTITISGWVCVERIREEDHISGPIDLSGDAEDRKEKRGTGSWTWAINKYIDRMHPNAAAEEEEEDEEGGLKSSCSLVLPGPTHLFRPPVNWMHIYTSCILSDLLLVLMMVMNNLSPPPPWAWPTNQLTYAWNPEMWSKCVVGLLSIRICYISFEARARERLEGKSRPYLYSHALDDLCPRDTHIHIKWNAVVDEGNWQSQYVCLGSNGR